MSGSKVEYSLRCKPKPFLHSWSIRHFVDSKLLSPVEMLRTWKMFFGRQQNRKCQPDIAVHVVRGFREAYSARVKVNRVETGSFLTIYLTTQMGRFWRIRNSIRAHSSKHSTTYIDLNNATPRYGYQSLFDPIFYVSAIGIDCYDLRSIAGRRVGRMYRRGIGERPALPVHIEAFSSAWLCMHGQLNHELLTTLDLIGEHIIKVLPEEADFRILYAPSRKLRNSLAICLFAPYAEKGVRP